MNWFRTISPLKNSFLPLHTLLSDYLVLEERRFAKTPKTLEDLSGDSFLWAVVMDSEFLSQVLI